MKNTKQLNIGNHRGVKRLWIEQRALNSICGFERGDFISIKYKDDLITIRACKTEGRKVSGRTRNDKFIPIIELMDQTFSGWCRTYDVSRVDIKFYKSKVLIKPCAEV